MHSYKKEGEDVTH